MPPRKKSNASSSSSSSKKPSKFGIQHFFDRHTASQQKIQQSNDANPNTASDSKPTTDFTVLPSPNLPEPSGSSKSGHVVLRTDALDASHNSGGSNNNDVDRPSEVTPPESLVLPGSDNAATESFAAEESPEMSKSVSLKRFKFSPGMFIKQSQDDGADEVTWKISPVNERLQAVSKQMPAIIKALSDTSRINLLPFRSCSENKDSLDKDGKVEKLFTSPTPKASAKSLVSMSKLGLKRINPDRDVDSNISAGAVSNSEASSGESPFRTPPSLSYCSDKLVKDIERSGPPHHSYLRHKKEFLELLDQVEDAIAVDDANVCNQSISSFKSQDGVADELPVIANHKVEKTKSQIPKEVVGVFSNYIFLVLEVTEKFRISDSSAAGCQYKVLRLLNEQTGEERAVNLWDEWSCSVVAPGDTVNVIGQFEGGNCNVDHDNNFLIVHPDILMSGTRVASSFSCARRTVLDERIKSNEYSIAALTGTLLHQIFQAGLIKVSPTVNFLEEYAEVVLQRNVESLYACQENEDNVRKTLINSIPKLLSWIGQFKNTEERKNPNVNFRFDDCQKKVIISEVIDIEEMAWAPKYGLKGMIDSSLRVKVQSTKDEGEKIMPLEFKTGKSSNSQSLVEHRAQVILYTLLMSERYQKTIDSGLLYYLQSDQTQGIVAERSDLVGLIMRRNELASDILKALTLQQLPPMLQSPSLCRSCRHLDVCSIYHKAHGGSTEGSGLGNVFDSHTNHLTSTHSKFLCHWDRLIDLEAKGTELLKKQVWRSHGLKNPINGGLSSIVLDSSHGIPNDKSPKDNYFIYRFVRQDTSRLSEASDGDPSSASPNDLDLTLRSGDHVILSNESSHQTIARGVISDISQIHVSVSFSKCLRIPGRSSTTHDLLEQVWRLDKDEYVTSFAIMRFNLVQLFLQNDRSGHLRRMIVDLEAPRFDSGSVVSQDPAISYVWSEKSLNDDQRRAVLKILTAKDYALILGMPGTGKTSTMVHAVKSLLIRGTSILLTAYTNSAVDNLLIKLKAQGIDFVRIGRAEAVHEDVREHCLSATHVKSVEDIKISWADHSTGILGPSNFCFGVRTCWGSLSTTSACPEARENGMGVSLFRRLSEAHPQAISALQSQYRMCQSIMDLSNALIYGDRLRCGSSEIANRKLEFSGLKCGFPWLEDVLVPSRPVVFIDTDMLPALETRDQKIIKNPLEAHIIAEISKELVNNGIAVEQIGVITPYNAQANLIRHAACMTSLEIHTIDKYQGRDKDCILVSFVRSSEDPTSSAASLLGDWHRINVALTRAKRKLIMVGSRRTLSKVPLLKLLIKKVEMQSGILSVSKKDIFQTGELKRCSQMR
ncbi:PREDICTED: DNA replication ATP-dependent helicase/nuclease DNA2 isoform X2 [Lupinus angustifolius]|uniref:DNA replication ATP-dependent helicase/nuclease DNA2 isoform X2 n=1 Tax=Lupinus angustifolius TaxID=3871 RepID=UPI00092EA45C|nr:PREDICTED: DNA replication ATP-dependent helicase/nuclease DNA2 isoform X2 [Lupinus angustifolius]